MKTIVAKELEIYLCKTLFKGGYTDKLESRLREKSHRLKQELGLGEEPVQFGYDRVSRSRTIKFSGIAGTVSFDAYQIEIMPKFYAADDKWRESMFNFIYIARSGRIRPQRASGLRQSRLSFYDHIALMFAESMEYALSRDNIQQYRTVDGASPYLRGRLMLTEQVRGLFAHPGQLYYEQNVLSGDNAFNYLLRWCTDALSSMVRNPEIKRRLLILRAVLPRTSSFFKIPVDEQLPPQYQHYREAVQIANNLAAGISASHQQAGKDGYGYVMAMAAVYEKFIEKTLKQLSFGGRSFVVEPQARSLFAAAREPGMKSFYTIPDNKVSFDGKPQLLIDAKYKNNFMDNAGKKPANSDAYQLFASLVSHGCRRGVLISPCDGAVRTCSKIWEINAGGESYIIALILLNLHDVSTNAAFAALKRDLEEEIVKIITY